MTGDGGWDALKSQSVADVFKAGKKAATLRRYADHVEFDYLPAYLSEGGPPVATSLPLCATPVRTRNAGAVPPFFAGLLPEGRRLGALHRHLKTSADDELTLLLAVGGDTIGDVQVFPPELTESPAPVASEIHDISQCDFQQLFTASIGEHFDRVSLPGVQDKISARMMTLPVNQAGNDFILKLNPPEFPYLVENEMFFLQAAKRSGIEAADARLVHDIHHRSGLLVRRFDREQSNTNEVIRLAQEDACQVLQIYPADKYRVDSEEVASGLARMCRSAPVAAICILRQFAFAYISCNGDAHAKNFSILRRHGEWRISPMYDVPSSYPYGDTTMALSIAGRRREDIGRAEFLSLGRSLSLPERAAAHMLDQLIKRCAAWLCDIPELPFSQRQNHKLQRSVAYRLSRLAG